MYNSSNLYLTVEKKYALEDCATLSILTICCSVSVRYNRSFYDSQWVLITGF